MSKGKVVNKYFVIRRVKDGKYRRDSSGTTYEVLPQHTVGWQSLNNAERDAALAEKESGDRHYVMIMTGTQEHSSGPWIWEVFPRALEQKELSFEDEWT
jgi:hypothetical protein